MADIIPPTVVLALSISDTTLSKALKSQFFVSSSTLISFSFLLRSASPVLGLDLLDLPLCAELYAARDAPCRVSGLPVALPFVPGFPFVAATAAAAASSASFYFFSSSSSACLLAASSYAFIIAHSRLDIFFYHRPTFSTPFIGFYNPLYSKRPDFRFSTDSANCAVKSSNIFCKASSSGDFSTSSTSSYLPLDFFSGSFAFFSSTSSSCSSWGGSGGGSGPTNLHRSAISSLILLFSGQLRANLLMYIRSWNALILSSFENSCSCFAFSAASADSFSNAESYSRPAMPVSSSIRSALKSSSIMKTPWIATSMSG